MPRQIPQGLKTCAKEMGTHYDRMTACIQETIKDTVPPRRKQKFNGHEVSAETKRLYDLRIRDFTSDHEITKEDRAAWNRTLNGVTKRDYESWVENRVQEIEESDEKGDMQAVHQGARTLSGKSKHTMT